MLSRRGKECGIVLGFLTALVIFTVLYQNGQENLDITKLISRPKLNNRLLYVSSDTDLTTSVPDSMSADHVIEQRLEERKTRLLKVCADPRYSKLTSRSTKGPEKAVAFNRLRYCGIPKCGTSFTYSSLPKLLQQHYSNKSIPSPFSPKEQKTYFIVREPYSRLFSAYLGKIVTNQPWWSSAGTHIVKFFRPNASEDRKRCGSDVTFAEFVKFVIKAQKDNWHKDHHWSPMYEQCSICKYDYDFIVHLETVKDDLQYIFKSVNISVVMSLSDEKFTMDDKCRKIVQQRPSTIKCEDGCISLGKVWWSFKARGFIANNIPFPITGEQCNTITGDEFAELSWDAHLRSIDHIDKRKQRRDALVETFLSVPLQDRLTFRDLYRKDFDLFGYDPQPPDIFPELLNENDS